MSSQPYSSTTHSRKRATHSYKNPTQTHYMPYEPHMAHSSSPRRSSSPPMTPYSIRHARSDALIRSSPEIASDTLFHRVCDRTEDPSFAWDPRYSPNAYPERAYMPLNHDYSSAHSYPPSSDFDVSDYSEDVSLDVPEVDSGHTSDSTPGHNSAFFSDTEEEENDGNDDEFSLGYSGYRTTFFRTSAERGQWKSHPIPFKSTPLPQAGRSASIPSRRLTPVLVDSTRTNSEPAPSTVTPEFSVHPDDPLPKTFGNVAESELQPETESPHIMSSLTSDWESIPDIDIDGHGYERSLSPLPPSSPMCYATSTLSRSVSPASSPVMRPSSPLSEISSLDQEERNADHAEDIYTGHPDIKVKIRYSIPVPTTTFDADIKLENTLGDGPATTSINLQSASSTLSVDAIVNSKLQVSPSSTSAIAQNPNHETKRSLSTAGDEVNITSEATDAVPSTDDIPLSPGPLLVSCLTDSTEDQSHPLNATHAERPKLAQTKVEDDNNKRLAARRKRRKGNDSDGDSKHPVLKKRKVKVDTISADLLHPMAPKSVRNKKAAAAEKDEKDPDQQVSVKPKRRRKGEAEVSISCPASSAKRGKPYRPALPKASSSRSCVMSPMTNINSDIGYHQPVPIPNNQDPEAAALNTEICGMLIETMALSRASSLPLSSLYKMVMQTQPSLKSRRSEQEWLTVFAQVLQEGVTGRGSGVFGKVESSGKDDSNRPLEAQWFYVPEKDEDQDRAALIKSMMPRPAKRTETKKYKQYYYRPLDKISKWDPEDEL